MNSYRCTYGKSITSCRAILFTDRHQLQHQQELNQNLQIKLAQLIIPICGFNDKNTVATPETIKQLKAISEKLAIHQGHLVREQEKINQIKNIFIV